MKLSKLSFLTSGSDMGRRIAAHDWGSTPTGPIEQWPTSLRTAVGIMLESRHPLLISWGSELTMFYNDAFALLAGAKHPVGLGRHGWEMFAEVWPTIGPMIERVLRHGEATWVDDQLLVMNRRGLAEETYWTCSYSPIRDSDGQVRGAFTATSDTTGRVLGERRLRTLSALGDASVVQARTVEQACTAAAAVLAAYRADLPAGMVYLLPAEGQSARLVADYGVRSGRASVAPALPGSGIEDSIQEVGRTGSPAVVARLSARYRGSFDFVASPIGGAEPDTVVILPLGNVGQSRPAGVLVLVVSPYRALDDDYRAFLDLVARQVGATVADSRAYSVQLRRAAPLAELDRIAETLQRSLLPQKLPELRRLMLAAHYQPGTVGTQAGGDWYDVIPLTDTRVAIVVGDVVGQGTPAAAVMSQLRNALAGYLLEGHPPATALEHLDRFACRVDGALGSSVACLVLDTVTGELRWARAGHPPPLVIDPKGTEPPPDPGRFTPDGDRRRVRLNRTPTIMRHAGQEPRPVAAATSTWSNRRPLGVTTDGLDLVTADHNRVRGLFARFREAHENDDTPAMGELADKITTPRKREPNCSPRCDQPPTPPPARIGASDSRR